MGKMANVPSVTAANVDEACAGSIALARMASGYLQAPEQCTPASPCPCDHWIVLDSCNAPADEYVFWTWGQLTAPKSLDWVRAAVCNFVVVDAVAPA